MDKLKQDEELQEKREQMIERQLKSRGIYDSKVLAAFRKVAREKFVPESLTTKAYEDHPLPIGYDQTISQPYIVAFMTECLELKKTDRVLEIGTGSAYQTAILAELVQEVYSIEIVEELHHTAGTRLDQLGYRNVHLKCGNGRDGWPEAAPFDKIIVAAASLQIPSTLIEELQEDGKIIMPLGADEQDLILGRKENGVLVTKQLIPVRFVPLQTESS